MKPVNPDLPTVTRDVRVDQVLKLAIFAVGGQGGGVLNNWIISVAEKHAFDVQATSIAGVAQRTGSTIYYLEMLPPSGDIPVFALAPTEGEIDILIAAEIMEAGRAIARGFLENGYTTVIASAHRQLATQEKVVPGDGTADSSPVMDALRAQAEVLHCFDMQRIAEEECTVISAALFGALAGSGALPFSEESFRDTLRSSGRGVAQSLAAFDRACAIAKGEFEGELDLPLSKQEQGKSAPVSPRGAAHLVRQWETLAGRVRALPAAARTMAEPGLRKTVEFQDLAYGARYLTCLEKIVQQDAASGGEERDYEFTRVAAKHIANAMCYDDILRVAAAKTRLGRFEEIEKEVGAQANHITKVTEYTHPGVEELVSLMPQRIGVWLEKKEARMQRLDQFVNKGRRIRTDRLMGFFAFYVLAGMRRWRRSTLRHAREAAHLEEWLGLCLGRLPRDYDFATESLKARRLIKGYSDTFARGQAKFDKVICATRQLEGRPEAAAGVRQLIDAAMSDPGTKELDDAIAAVQKKTRESPGNILGFT